MIVSSRKIFGFPLYEKKLLWKKTVILEEETIPCEDIGLNIIYHYPNLDFSRTTIVESIDWEEVAVRTISLGFLKLLDERTIEITQNTHAVSYLNELYKKISDCHEIFIADLSTNQDLLVKELLSTIDKLKDYNCSSFLFKFTRQFLNQYLGEFNTYNKPEKKFVISVLRKYASEYKWLNISNDARFLGIILPYYKVDLERIYLPRLSMQHSNLESYHKRLLNKDPAYRSFVRELHKVLTNEFQRRHPSNRNKY